MQTDRRNSHVINFALLSFKDKDNCHGPTNPTTHLRSGQLEFGLENGVNNNTKQTFAEAYQPWLTLNLTVRCKYAFCTNAYICNMRATHVSTYENQTNPVPHVRPRADRNCKQRPPAALEPSGHQEEPSSDYIYCP